MIITIDGPVGTGKSTIAKLLAKTLNYSHFDTGAMYRIFTYGVLKHNISINSEVDIKKLLTDFDFKIDSSDGEKKYFFEGEDISEKIRQTHVTSHVSEVAALPSVRDKLVDIQRSFGSSKNAVFEGRDMGTVVFPNAGLKIFLTASPEIRAERRFDELKMKFPNDSKNLTFKEVLASVKERDFKDMNRKVSPLKKACDAHEIDTSNMSIDEVINAILELCE